MKRRKVLILILIVVVLASITWITWKARATVGQAEGLRLQLSRLQVGKASFEEVRNLAHEYQPWMQEASNCSASNCTYSLVFQNWPLHVLKLAPRTVFSVTMQVLDGRLNYVGSSLTSVSIEGFVDAGAYVIEADCSPCDPAEPPLQVSRRTKFSGQPFAVHVRVNPKATHAERERAYRFDLGCLQKLGGCSEPDQLLPTALVKSASPRPPTASPLPATSRPKKG